jgi:alpha-tubulin suppressor-like RCC1 family protein
LNSKTEKDPASKKERAFYPKIACGCHTTILLKEDGTVWAWGRNDPGQLGDGTNQERFTPVQVRDPEGTGFLTDITMIAAGGSYGGNSAAVRSDGTLFLWGDNNDGQLGDGSEKTRLLPVKVPGFTGAKAVAIGGQHVIALKLDGTVWAWGYNNDRQLGINTDEDTNTPVQIPELSGIQEISAGGAHNAAIDEKRTVFIWGDDSYDRLGDGTMACHLSGYK